MKATVIRCTAPGSLPIATDAFLATELAVQGIGLLSVSLFSEDEAARYRHDADFMAERILEEIAAAPPDVPVGILGYATTAAGAIIAASQRPDKISAVVAVNGRTDLAVDELREVHVPTMLLVNDMPVLRVNREALALIKSERRIEIVHGNGEEAVRAMVDKTVRWFADKLVRVAVVA
ncbi:MAG TPA: hypothetical protein VF980_16915 [Thermoanaerobaculia bacterium]